MAWRPEEIRDRFKAAAESARRYAEEVARRPDKSDYDRELQDAYLAVFRVYGYFGDEPFLDSREALLSELRRLLAQGPDVFPAEVCNRAVFARYWRRNIEGLIERYGREGAESG